MSRKLQPVFKRVLDCFESYSDFARAMGTDRQLVYYWMQIGFIPAMYAVQVANATEGVVSVAELVNEAHREKLKQSAAREARRALAWKDPVVDTPAEGGQ